MYLVGAPHPHKTDAQLLLERSIAKNERIVTDAEVLQEILHRYTAIDRRDAIEPVFAVISEVVDTVLPVTEDIVLRTKEIVLGRKAFSARDALHLAVMEKNGIDRILSFDRHFDGWVGVTRIHSLS
jgi:predicted nucleic acid-binding protein